nr:unnamed protein product [Spirometra erinaceieuropaei]
MIDPDEAKTKSDEDLSKRDKLTIFGEFSARLGTNCAAWRKVLGPQGIAGCSGYELFLVRTCAEHCLLLANTFFYPPMRRRPTWMHPRLRRWQLLDYVFVRRQGRLGVLMIKAICDADGWADHGLAIFKMELRLQAHRRPRGKQPPGKLNITLLSLLAHRLYFSNRLTQRLGDLPAADEKASVETRWCRLRDAVRSTALAVLRCSRRQHQDKFDGKDAVISNLMAEKNRLNGFCLDRPTDANKAAFYQCCRLEQERLQEIPDCRMTRKAEEIKGYAERSNIKKFIRCNQGDLRRPALRRNDNQQVCDNHRCISPLNIAGKIFARTLLNRLNGFLEQGLLSER